MGLFGQEAMTPKLQVVVPAGAVNQTVIQNFSINSKSCAIYFYVIFAYAYMASIENIFQLNKIVIRYILI